MSIVGSPTVMTFGSTGDANTTASRYSCIDRVKAKTAVVAIPGRLGGSTIRTKPPASPQPSSQAASSSSRGTVRKTPLRSHVQNGIVNVGYRMTSAHHVSLSPSRATTGTRGRKRTIGGTSYVMNMAMPVDSAPGSRRRPSA
jgi:hypothetical protein